MNATHELAGEFKRIHEDFGYTSEKVPGGGSAKAALARTFIPLFKPLEKKLEAGTRAMKTDQEFHRANYRLVMARSRRDLVRSLRTETVDVFSPIVETFIESLAADPASRTNLLQTGRLLPAATKEMKRKKKIQSGPDEQTAINLFHEIILFGIYNLAHQIWALFEVIPHIQEETPRILGPRRYEALAESTYSILTQLAASHDEVFHTFMGFMNHGKTEEKSLSWPAIKPHIFDTKGDSVAFKPELFLCVRHRLTQLHEEEGLRTDEPYIGCIGSFLFRPVFDGCVNAARESLFHAASHVAALPSEHEERFMEKKS